MTATSASNANQFLAENVAEIRLPGSDRTYEVRDVLRGMGLRWDPATHAWHGRLLAAQRAFLERRYGLATKAIVPIEAFERASVALGTLSPAPAALLTHPRSPTGPRGPPRDDLQTNHSGSSHPRSFLPGIRTRVEARIAFPVADEDAEEIATPTRRFSFREISSGHPDDSREEDERVAKMRLRDLRARVKAARAVVSTTSGISETLRADWKKAAMFYARFGITEGVLRSGVQAREVDVYPPRAQVSMPE